MKKLLFICLLFSLADCVDAQTGFGIDPMPSGFFKPSNRLPRYLSDSSYKKKWSLNTFTGLSASFIGWKEGHATTFSVPVGLELDRRINNNLFAFAAVSAAPTIINFRPSFLNTEFNKVGFTGGFLKANQFAVFPKAELGLKYVNDARTFEIRGSMSIQRVPVYYYPVGPINNSSNPF